MCVVCARAYTQHLIMIDELSSVNFSRGDAFEAYGRIVVLGGLFADASKFVG